MEVRSGPRWHAFFSLSSEAEERAGVKSLPRRKSPDARGAMWARVILEAKGERLFFGRFNH